MFYSHTFLAKKGPLGTVWCAAHLQHKLKKSQYTATDICSTVDEIMFPDVPIALRLSGHLLLGVVRIYSKKVDYLHHDCRIFSFGISKAFLPSEVNLPEDATHAPIQSITLPEKYALEDMEVDDRIHSDRVFDSFLKNSIQDDHLRDLDEITLPDQMPVDRELYVSITFDEAISMDVSNMNGVELMEIPMVEEGSPGDGGNNHAEASPHGGKDSDRIGTFIEGQENPEYVPEIEVQRAASHDYSPENLVPPVDLGYLQAEPVSPVGQYDHGTAFLSPIAEDVPFTREQTPTLTSRQHPHLPSASSREAHDISDLHIPFDHESPILEMRPSPQGEAHEARRKRRKIGYDEAPVLPNRSIRNALNDPSHLLRMRKLHPSSALGLWKLNNNLSKENMFVKPSFTGYPADLQNIFDNDFMFRKCQLVLVEEDTSEERIDDQAGGPLISDRPTPVPTLADDTPVSVPESYIEIPRFPAPQDPGGSDLLSGSAAFPSLKFDVTPTSRTDTRSVAETLLETTGTESFLDPGTSTQGFASEHETPLAFMGAESGGLSAIQELTFSPEEDLHFLDADNNNNNNNTPTTAGGSRVIQEIDTLSVRTRAVAQYLKGVSPITGITEENSDELSLNNILEGRRRKTCARMFFETLVLTSYGLVNVEQKQAYGDILLKLTPSLSKAQL